MSPRLAWLLAACCLAGPAPAGAQELRRDFFNVLLADAADPWVVRHDGFYYYVGSTGDGVVLTRARHLSLIGAGERKAIWRAPATGPNSREIWAPELHRLRGRWYVYYAADDGKNENHRMYVLENPNSGPFEGEWIDRGRLRNPFDDHWAIDMTAFEHRGQLYAVWSGWEGSENIKQDLYIAPMSDPLTISGPRVRISRPTELWETIGDPDINEGPTVFVRGDTVNLIYSASGSWGDYYCIGLLTARADADLLDRKSWTKHPDPVFRSGNLLQAPGHASVVRTADGGDWLVYHVARHTRSGWSREVRAQPFRWNPDGTPRFGAPAPPGTPIPLPAGEPARRRYEVEAAELGEASAAADPTASGGKSVELRGPVALAVEAEADAPYALAVRYARHVKADVREGRLTVALDEPVAATRLPGTGTDPGAGAGRWSVAHLRVPLRKGRNLVRIAAREGDPVALDCVDVAPLDEEAGR